MKTQSKFATFFVWSLILVLLLPACQTSSSVSKGLSVKESLLAKKTGDTWEPVDNGRFKKGDVIGLIMLDVSGFKKDKEGFNWMDIDVEVKDPDGEVIVNEEELLGEAGRIKMENNTAKSPVGSFYSTDDLKEGKYTIKVTLYDKIGNGKTVNSKSFILE